MNGEARDLAGELADRLEAAGALIERLEREVAGLRRDLEQANVALQAARREVSARERRISELEEELADSVSRAPGHDAEQRLRELAARLRETREESERRASELESLRRLVEPHRRLGAGIALFNESAHARDVAAISKSFGLPEAHAGLDDGSPARAVLTFVWGEMTWRRYVSEPGPAGQNVYLAATGDDPAQIKPPFEPNARVDARGRITLGAPAR